MRNIERKHKKLPLNLGQSSTKCKALAPQIRCIPLFVYGAFDHRVSDLETLWLLTFTCSHIEGGTPFFVLVARNLLIRSRQLRCESENHGTLRSIYDSYCVEVGDFKIFRLLTSCCHKVDGTNRLFVHRFTTQKTRQLHRKRHTLKLKVSER